MKQTTLDRVEEITGCLNAESVSETLETKLVFDALIALLDHAFEKKAAWEHKTCQEACGPVARDEYVRHWLHHHEGM